MSDNKTKKGVPDTKRINTGQSYEVTYWTQKWGISTRQLKAAIKATGSTSAGKVEQYLKRKGVI